MVFLPTIGTGGYTGWLILERTEASQREAFDSTAMLERNIDYFRENISTATTAEALVTDRQLLTVALGAFGLSDEIDKRAFIRKILEEGTEDTQSFANRLNDSRFRDMTEAFGYGNEGGAQVTKEAFQEDIIARYKTLEFEQAVGDVDNDMRLAMNFKREIAGIAESGVSETTAWFQIMGNQPLREFVATALNIPSEVTQLDIDRQQEIFAQKSEQLLGSSDPAIFADSEQIDETIRRFFLNLQVQNGPSALTPGYGALVLLQSSSLGASASQNLFMSQF